MNKSLADSLRITWATEVVQVYPAL